MKKLLLTLFCMLWCILGVNADTYTYTFKQGNLKTAGGTATLNKIDWQYSNCEYIGWDSSKGIQIGSGKKPAETWSISTDGITGTITSVKVNASCGSDGKSTISVNVGNSDFICNNASSKNLTTTSSDYEFTGSASGKIKINMAASAKAMYIKSITITYDSNVIVYPTECATPTWSETDGSTIPAGKTITATCETPNSTVTIYEGDNVVATGEVKDGEVSYTTPPTLEGQTVTYTAKATVKGEGDVDINSEASNITLTFTAPSIVDELTTDSFDLSGTAYVLSNYISSDTNVTYFVKSCPNSSAIQINTSSKSDDNNVNSGIVSTENPEGYVIESIILTKSDGAGTPIVKVSNTPGSKIGNIGDTKKDAQVIGASDGVELKSTINKDTYTYTPSENYKYLAITSNSKVIYLSNITINYKKVNVVEPVKVAKPEVTIDGALMDEGGNSEILTTDKITISCTTDNAVIKYTLKQGETTSEEQTYSEPFSLSEAGTYTINAWATAEGNFLESDHFVAKFKVKEPIITPSQVVITPTPDNDIVNIKRYDKVSFTSENATKLEVELIDDVHKDSKIYEVEGSTYEYILTCDNVIITVIPIDNYGTKYEELAGCVEINRILKSQTTITFDYKNGSLLDSTKDNTTSYTTISQEPGLFSAIISGDGNIEYIENSGWKFSADSDLHKLNIISNEVDGIEYSISKIELLGDFSNAVIYYDSTKELTDNAATSFENDKNVVFDILHEADFILTGINITFEHDIVEMPTLESFDNVNNMVRLTAADNHKIFYRVISEEPETYRAEAVFSEYTRGTDIEIGSGQKIEAYSVHPHGMKSDIASASYNSIITGVENIVSEPDNSDVRWFNLQGQQVNEPADGIYIRVKNGRATKVVF